MQAVVSLETALVRIHEIQTALTPPAPQPAPSAAPGDASFAQTLQGAVAATTHGGATAPGATTAAPGHYPHLDGDLDCSPELLRRLEALAARRGEHFHITSGLRTYVEQQRLWNGRGANPYPVARPGPSPHLAPRVGQGGRRDDRRARDPGSHPGRRAQGRRARAACRRRGARRAAALRVRLAEPSAWWRPHRYLRRGAR